MRTLFLALLVSLPSSKEQTVRLALPSGVHISIVEAPFQSSGIAVQGCTKSASVCLVGGKPYGLATGLPRTYIRKIVATYGDSKFVLDGSGIYDAEATEHASHSDLRFFGGSCQDARNCAFRAVLGDAANAIAAEWIVIDGIVQRTILSGDADIVQFFQKNIDPPTYE